MPPHSLLALQWILIMRTMTRMLLGIMILTVKVVETTLQNIKRCFVTTVTV